MLIPCLSASFVLLNVGSVQPDTSHTLSCLNSFHLGEKFSGSFYPLARHSRQFRQIQLSSPILKSGSMLAKNGCWHLSIAMISVSRIVIVMFNRYKNIHKRALACNLYVLVLCVHVQTYPNSKCKVSTTSSTGRRDMCRYLPCACAVHFYTGG